MKEFRNPRPQNSNFPEFEHIVCKTGGGVNVQASFGPTTGPVDHHLIPFFDFGKDQTCGLVWSFLRCGESLMRWKKSFSIADSSDDCPQR